MTIQQRHQTVQQTTAADESVPSRQNGVALPEASDARKLLRRSVRRESSPDAHKRIASVKYLEEGEAFLIKMGTGRLYVLRLAELSDAQRSAVVRCRVGPGRYYFIVVQESGNRLEIPYDFVLYHCEPDYEYYKGRQTNAESEADRAARIGGRVRALRKERGLTITALATRARILRPNVSRLEAGKHVPSLETLEKIAAGLGVTVADLIAIRSHRAPATSARP